MKPGNGDGIVINPTNFFNEDGDSEPITYEYGNVRIVTIEDLIEEFPIGLTEEQIKKLRDGKHEE